MPHIQSPAGKGGGPSPFSNAFSPPAISSLRYNTSQAGSPVFLCYGTTRVSVNLIEEWGYNGYEGKGGKGGGSSGGKKNANYTADVAWAICQGPVSFYGAQGDPSSGNSVWSNGGISNIGSVGLNPYRGYDGQTPDPVFESSDPNSPVIGYSGTCYMTGTPIELGSSPALPNISFQICGFGSTGAGGSGGGTALPDDANPAFIIEDLLTNPRYGAGFPAANLDSAGALANFGTFCQAASIALSLLLDRVQPCARWIEEICELCVAAPVWSGALFKIIPYSDAGQSSNGATWEPVLTWQYSLADGDFLDFGGGHGGAGGSDPVILTRKDPATMTNWLSLEYLDKTNSYNPQVLPVWDQGLIDQYGTRNEPPVQAHEITNAATATYSAQLQLQRKAYVRNTYKFKLGFRYSLLEPMDIVLLNDATVGLAAAAVRIIQIDEDDNGELTVTAEEIPGVTP